MTHEEDRERCESCGREVAGFDTLYLSSEGKSKLLCTQCFNDTVSELACLDFEHPTFESVEMLDSEGISHRFRFRTILSTNYMEIEAREIGPEYPEGYNFRVLGDPEGDPLELFQKLYQRIRQAMGRKHLEKGEYGFQIGDEQVVRGTIAWDDGTQGERPLLVVDGKGITWEDFGRTLMMFEG